MGPFQKPQMITLGVVERAMEQERRERERRSGEDRRDAPPEPPKEKGALLPLLMFLLGLVVAASTWNFTKLESDYQGFKSDEISRHERDAELHAKMDARISATEKSTAELAAQGKLQKAIARKLGVKVED